MNNDLISREALKEVLFIKFGNQLPNGLFEEIDNAPAVEAVKFEYHDKLIKQAYQKGKDIRPEGKWIPIKTRELTEEEMRGGAE